VATGANSGDPPAAKELSVGREAAEASVAAVQKEVSSISALLDHIQDEPTSPSIEFFDPPTKAAIGAAVAAVSGEKACKELLEGKGQGPPEGDVALTPPLKIRSVHSSGGFSGDALPGLPFAGMSTGMERIPGLGVLGSPRKSDIVQEPMPEDDAMLQDEQDDLEASLYQCAS
jgi:hypothetical protein